jgi:hypothetical protein
MRAYWKIPYPLRAAVVAGVAAYCASFTLRHIGVTSDLLGAVIISIAGGIGVGLISYQEIRHQRKDRSVRQR